MPNKIASNLKRGAALSGLDWFYLAIAVKELFVARLCLAMRPASTIRRARQGGYKKMNCSLANFTANVDISRLKWAISAAAPRMPWRSDCLPRALAAERWLRRCRLQPRLFIGVSKEATGGLKAHAWLQCKGVTVVGGEIRHFTVLMEPTNATFKLDECPVRMDC